MKASSIHKSVWDVIHLAASAVDGCAPDIKRVATMDLDEVYRVSQRHLLVSVCTTALESADVHDERFTQARGKAVRKTALMDADRSELFRRMETDGIWYLPLKGCVLQGLYPTYGMRQMADNDILFDASRAEDMRAIMVSMGFSTKYFGQGNHDIYHKEPVCNFELHRTLFSPMSDERIASYYQDVERLLLPDDDGSMGRHLSDEDFYVYMVAHEYKHFSAGGTGLRSLLDTHIYLSRCSDAMDWDYIDAECTKLGIADFEVANRKLSQRLFDGEELDDSDYTMLAYVASSGAYGTIGHGIANQVARRGRLGYLVWRAFPPVDSMQLLYPVLCRVPGMLPVFWVWRLVSAMAIKPKTVLYQVRTAMTS